MKSFSILRTNTGLTSNIKIIVDSKYNLFLESIDSDPELADTKFKKVQFNKNNFFDELLPYFFKDLPSDIAFSVKYDNDNDQMSTDFSQQYDDMYIAGAKNILDNKNYKEEYEYFAPLYLFKQAVPKYFSIFRIDGPGLSTLTKDNFKSEFLKNFKTVKLFDLTKNTVLGEWIDNNFKNNSSFPVAPLDVDFRELEFTKWIGIDYETGGYTYKSFFLDSNLENENTLFDFEKLFFDGYRINKVIFPNIVNFSFLFDDTPSTPTSLRTWSLNRYAGFYLDDIELLDTITPYIMPELHSDVIITTGNIISSSSYGDPFKQGFRNDIDMFVEYLGNFYKVKPFQETSGKSVNPVNVGTKSKKVMVDMVTNAIVTKYRIISDVDLSNKQSFLNQRSCYINNLNQIVKVSDDSAYLVDGIELADVNLIEIDGIFHNIIIENGFITLVTDYGFKFSKNNTFTYYTNSGLDGYTKSLDLFVTPVNSPVNFKIYRVKFTDIKDFDTCIIDTEFSKFEYEKRNDLTNTEESKMFLTDLRSSANPQEFDDFTFNGRTQYVPVSSDYTANLETFRIDNTQTPSQLSELWRKNPIHCRWGFQNSISSHDYPYLLNNNDIHENFNRTVDTQGLLPNRFGRNLDYFYSINSGTTSYLHHSLHIESNFGSSQDSSYHFELDKYLEVATYSFPVDYFSLLFSTTQSFIDGEIVVNKNKFSYIESGDNVIPNSTLFRGLKFKIFEVDNIKSNSISIENTNLIASNLFQDYKFSILMSSNDYMVSDTNILYKPYFWDYFTSSSTGGALQLNSINPISQNIFNPGMVEIDTFYPNISPLYQFTASNVNSISGNSFTVDKAFYGSTQSIQSGIFRNKMQWQVIKKWETDKLYQQNDLVIWEDTVFKVISATSTSDPNINPTNCSAFQLLDANGVTSVSPAVPLGSFTASNNPFWNYNFNYSMYFWVYRYGEYYQINNANLSAPINFWNPSISYSLGTTVIYDNRYFTAATFSIPSGIRPVSQNKKIQLSSGGKYWVETPNVNLSNCRWLKVPLWDKNTTYNSNGATHQYVVYNDVLYMGVSSNISIDDIPGLSPSWRRVYSFVPDTSYCYSPSPRYLTSTNQQMQANTIIKLTDHYYYCKYNPGYMDDVTKSGGLLTLDDGITIYINKKWKNILINIAINDNTIQTDDLVMDKTKNLERDELYVETNSRLTAANFIRQINDLDTLYGFADYVSYVIIEEDGSFKKYNFNNIEDLPYMVICEEADNFNLINGGLKYSSNTLDKSIIKPSRSLVNGNIDNLEKIDFYNQNPLGVSIVNTKDTPLVTVNLNNQTNNVNQVFYRHSGYYMPVFYDIDLFQKYEVVYPVGDIDGYSSLIGNYIFDTNLSLFGVMKQRVLTKVNRSESILKLKNNKTYDSIYPMLDEYGYMVADFFIFKSTWDFEYHIEANKPNTSSVPTLQNIYQTLYTQSIVKKYNSI